MGVFQIHPTSKATKQQTPCTPFGNQFITNGVYNCRMAGLIVGGGGHNPRREECKQSFHTFYKEKDAIGKRYRRMDAIGTPFCVTIDHQTKEDNTVTIRYRDTMLQERIALKDVRKLVMEKIEH